MVAGIAAMVGVDLPVQPVARPIWFTEPMPNRPENVPMTIDFTTGFYFHSEGPGLLFGMADTEPAPGFDAPMRPDWLEVVGDVVAHRAPALLEVGIAGGWHGYYETTPDHNALIGEAAACRGSSTRQVSPATAFYSGPAVGEVLRDLVLGHAPPVDVSGFDVERFARARRDPSATSSDRAAHPPPWARFLKRYFRGGARAASMGALPDLSLLRSRPCDQGQDATGAPSTS